MSGMVWLRIGAVLGFLAVAAGAFGAHGLEGRLEARALDRYETAVKYQVYHALALLAVGLLAMSRKTPGTAIQVSGWAFLLGIILFSGSLYAYALSGLRWLGMITPFGGIGFLVGWVALALSGSEARNP